MTFKIDPRKVEPVFVQLVNQVKTRMAKGHLKPGDKLPTVRELASELLINPNTVQKAYQELIRENLIFSRKGLGNFIAEMGTPHQKQLRHPRLQELATEFQTEARLAGHSPKELPALFKKYLHPMNEEDNHD